MKKLFSLCVALVVVTLSARGADSSPKPDGATNNPAADELWQSILKIEHDRPPADRTAILERLKQWQNALLGFEQQYPADPRHWEARLTRFQVESGLAQINGQPTDDAALFALTKEVIAAPDASGDTKADARYMVAEKRMELVAVSGSFTNGPARAAADAALQEVRQKYPDDERTLQMQLEVADFYRERDPKTAEAILHEMESNKNPQAAAMAHRQLLAMKAQQGIGKEPLDLKFEAVDGTKIDVAKMRGKVVLVDFWASWCGPCRMELPFVVAAYKGLHDKGFEVVGISLDQNKDQMVKFAKAAGMTWPQYFDGKGWGNEISGRYGITAIPAAWLLDKKGIVRSTEARGGDLGEQVKKLLAE